ncbi:unnamed protein product, partial [Chrysoparadoxa australica]
PCDIGWGHFHHEDSCLLSCWRLASHTFSHTASQLPTHSTLTRASNNFPPHPAGSGGGVTVPAVCVFSEIYQVSGPLQRLCRKLAGELGLIAACPESYHEFEDVGTVLPYNEVGTARGNDLKVQKSVAGYDADNSALVKYLL